MGFKLSTILTIISAYDTSGICCHKAKVKSVTAEDFLSLVEPKKSGGVGTIFSFQNCTTKNLKTREGVGVISLIVTRWVCFER